MLPPASDDHFSCIDTKLHDAVRYSDLEEVIEALRDGLDPNQIGTYLWSPLHEACSNGEDDIVKVLIQHGGDPNKADSLRGCTALHYAASLGHKSCLQVLLQAGGKYDIQNKDGKSCLDVAVDPCLALLAKNGEKTSIMEGT
ncbi:hypothetical protein CAPTEDRAFT_119264 [Capitella teleta]|uniref:Uncharacterized protein n=1 Tax=Capitella teleta TaxID=283909 RepID=R7UY55_CAPTE|nr:hypothetical protein CAPTEDRAFT_119264 [Capitella teleta]|eukprot:ELU11177.1 hypothetical protein CAPTEDRAFT_119264 [Capitella teleta]